MNIGKYFEIFMINLSLDIVFFKKKYYVSIVFFELVHTVTNQIYEKVFNSDFIAWPDMALWSGIAGQYPKYKGTGDVRCGFGSLCG
jgi:hypothetical protein